MSDFKSIKAEEFDCSPFRLIGKDWMLITAQQEGRVNSMTASWGGLGVMWGKNAVYMVIRKSRFTKEFIDHTETFSLCFFDHQQHAKMLNYMGSVSGRDADKVKECGLTAVHQNGIPYYQEANRVLLCRKMCCQPLVRDSFIDKQIDEKWYSDKDYHDLYIGEILDILVK